MNDDVNWAKVPQDKVALHAESLIAATLLAIAQNYKASEQPVNVNLALDQAREHLNECLKIDPNNYRARQLVRQCEILEANVTATPMTTAR